MKQLTLVLLLLLSACSPDQQLAATDTRPASVTVTPPVLSWDGYGAVRFGMKITDAVQLAGGRSDADRALNPDCDYTGFASLPGVRFMVENGVITRGEADARIPNSLGIVVGASLAAVTATHSEAVVTPHKYDANGHYVLFRAPQRNRAIVLEVQNNRVTLIRAGLQPAVEYVESCS